MPTRRRGRTTSRAVVPSLLLLASACASDSRPPAPPPSVAVRPAEVVLGPGGRQAFSATVDGAEEGAVEWSVRPSGSGSITPDGLYTAPAGEGVFAVVAMEPRSGASGEAAVTISSTCWTLRAVDRVRFFPRPGQEAAMEGGVVTGSTSGPTAGDVALATISAVSPGWNELAFANAVPHRWVRYVGPPGSYGQVAELELWSGTVRVGGEPFGFEGERATNPGHPYAHALDADPSTYFDGPVPSGVYVGLDAAAGHVAAAPTMDPPPGAYATGRSVTLSSATPGATIRYTTDGSDPAGGAVYAAPVPVAATTTLRAVASAPCAHPSDVSTGLYAIAGGQPADQSVYMVGNSLTDQVALDAYLGPVAAAGGVNLALQRFTRAGIGTWVYPDYPEAQSVLQDTASLTQITFQPAANLPCLPYCAVGPSDGCVPCDDPGDGECWTRSAPFVCDPGGDITGGRWASDGDNIHLAWDHAQARSPGATIWVYQTWPRPGVTPLDCLDGAPSRSEAIWDPAPSQTYEQSVAQRLQYVELVRAHLRSIHPERPTPWIVPGGSALVALKARIEGGTFPGLGQTDWPSFVYALAYDGDDHLNEVRSHYLSLVFYAALFQRDPRALPDGALGTTAVGLAAAQYAALQELAHAVVAGEPLAGWTR